MPDGIVIHREAPPASGIWSPRPAELAGITPVAVLVFGNVVPPIADGSTGSGLLPLLGASDGVRAGSHSYAFDDGTADSNTRAGYSFDDLLYAIDANTVEQLRINAPVFVPGGFDATIQTNLALPNIVCIFFHKAGWQAHVGHVVHSNVIGNSVFLATGFSGTNDNQLIFNLHSVAADKTGSGNETDRSLGLGLAYRRGPSPIPAAQHNLSYLFRNNTGAANLPCAYRAGFIQSTLSTSVILTEIEVSSIADNQVEFTTRNSTARRDATVLVLSTGADQAWSGPVNSLIANGDLIVSDPGFQPAAAGLFTSQVDLDGYKPGGDFDQNIGGMTVGNAVAEFSELWSNQGGASTMNANSRPNSQFLDVPQDNNTDGWKSGPADFSLTATGYRVDNIVVSPGAPDTVRFWLSWAIEGEGVVGPVVLPIENLVHSRPVDQVPIIVEAVLLNIEGLDHPRPVDAVSALGIDVPLFLDGLNHQRPVDAVLLIPTEQAAADDLRHPRTVDIVDVTEVLGVPLSIGALDHVRPVDAPALDVEASIVVADLGHARPVDIVDIQPIMGDSTAIGATAAAWYLDAGQTLTNAAAIDFSYHVIAGVFDGAASALDIDLARVTGQAGSRELTALTLGADVDGQRRVQGEIAEVRIYQGALSVAQREQIRAELAQKWITG